MLHILQKAHLNWCLCRNMYQNTSKIQTLPLNHNPYLRLCELHLLTKSQLYSALHHSVTGALVHRVGTSRTQRKHQFRIAFVRKYWMIQLPGKQNVTFHNSFPIQTFRGTARTRIHFRVAYRKLPIFTDVGIQTNYIHIVNFLPCLTM